LFSGSRDYVFAQATRSSSRRGGCRRRRHSRPRRRLARRHLQNWTDGSGDFNNTDAGIGTGDDVVFGGADDVVTVTDPTTVSSLTFNAGSQYTIQGEAIALTKRTNAIESSGNNKILSDIEISGSLGNGGTATLKVDDGVLTINKVTWSYGLLEKTGSGTLKIDGSLNTGLSGGSLSALLVTEGTLILSGNNHSLTHVSGSFGGVSAFYCCNVSPGATLGGNGSVTYSENIASPFNIYGNLAPGDNPGDTGTFTIAASNRLPDVIFRTGSALCIDLVAPDNELGDFDGTNHDIFKMTVGSYGQSMGGTWTGSTLTFEKDAIIRLSGNIATGIYNIIQLEGNTGTYVVVNPDDYADTGLGNWGDNTNNWMKDLIVEVPSGYDITYHFDTLTAACNNNYERITCIALVIDSVSFAGGSPVPEPASLALLSLGSGLLLLRRKHRS